MAATIFGGCLGKDVGQHRRCKITSGEYTCECTCENHGVDYQVAKLDSPLHLILMQIGKEHGIIIDDVEGDDSQSEAPAEDEETIEQLEEKRK